MRKLVPLLVLFALVLLLGGALAQMMAKDPGVMLLSWNGWLVETTFWVGLGLIVCFLLLIYGSLWLFRRLAPTVWLGQLQLRRRRRQARIETQHAIERWMQGHDETAEQALQKVVKAGGSDRLPRALGLALGLTHADWPDRLASFIQQDAALSDYARMLQAERYWQLKQPEAFMALLNDYPRLAALPALQRRYWQALVDHNRAEQAIAAIISAQQIQPDERQDWLVRAVTQALKDAEGNKEQGQRIIKALSKVHKALPAISLAEIDHLISVDEQDVAFKRIKQHLQQSDRLDDCQWLLKLSIDDKLKLDYLHSLKPSQPSAVYCRVMGLLHSNLAIWGAAQSWFEQAWQQQDDAAGVHLAQIYQQRGMETQAAQLYQTIAQNSLQQTSQKEQ